MTNKKLYSFSENLNKYIVQTTILSSLKLIASIAFAWLFAFLLKTLIERDFNQNYLLIIVSIIIIIFIRQFSTKITALKLGDLVVEVKRNLRKSIFEKILKLGLNYSEFFKIQEFIHLSVDNVEHLEVYFGAYLTQFYYCIASSIILFLVTVPFSLKAAFILLFFSLFIPLFLYISLNKVKKIQKKYFAKYMNVGILFLDSLQGLTTLKLYGSDEAREKEIAQMSEEFRVETMRVLKMQLLSIAVVNWIIYAGTILAIIFSIRLFLVSKLSLFGLFFIFMLAPEFFIPMRTLTSLFHVAMTGIAAADNIINFLEAPEEKSLGNDDFPEISNISIQNFNFSYPNSDKILNNINISFKENSLTAIVGHSGCGKSTLASILAGEIKAEECSKISIGKTKLNEIKIEERPKNILKITHDSHIFEDTVRENLAMAKPDSSDQEMIEVLKQVKLWDIFKVSNGLDTILKSQGKNLSGGQAQRVSIARALLYNAKIYIFDEATSNIDVESEEIILDIIYELSKTKTVIFISHRLAAIKNADNIYVMDKGFIIENGQHKELYEKNGLYKEMYLYQEELENYLKGRGEK
ncbi:ABC transporter ATP-binding protein/permease [Fusobacterium russii]|uniref:ABC transporter ATP-binding protein/permease n=1 Tax=Fusobacterium russii TaxID=854 RepID=UPI0003A2A53F|nr:ABC transporter ATP-binding protein/permease [Fusobacterium russii]